MSDNLEIWNKVCRPPESALKKISGGRLSGMTDINPQWRYHAMTETFGPCGIGWKYAVDRQWTEPGPAGEVLAFTNVLLYVRASTIGDVTVWSDPIPGTGGSMLVAKESSGLRANDEAFKMSLTDALSVAMKQLGVAADIYEKKWDGTKYVDGGDGGRPPAPALARPQRLAEPEKAAPLTLTGGSFEEEYGRLVTPKEIAGLMALLDKHSVSTDALKRFCAERWQVQSRKELRVRMLPVISEWITAEGKEVA